MRTTLSRERLAARVLSQNMGKLGRNKAVVLDRRRNGGSPEIVRCIGCGEQLADVLARLGSLHCHDCRESGAFHPFGRGSFGR